MTRSRLLAAVAAAVSGSPAAAGPLAVSLVDLEPLPPSATDQFANPVALTGVSGIAYLGGSTFAIVPDNSDALALLSISFNPDGSFASVTLLEGLRLDVGADYEGIAPGGFGSVLLASEGGPLVSEHSLVDGGHVRDFAVPPLFASRRANRGFESLAADKGVVWTANEEALTVDGPTATPSAGTLVRLLRFDLASATPTGQFAYPVSPMHGPFVPFGSPGQSGLSDLVLLPDGRLLSLERSLAFATPLFLARIYEVDLAGATDVSPLGALTGGGFTAGGKTLLWSSPNDTIGNLEGLCLGPELAGGGFALVGVVDDGDPLSTSQLVALRLTGLEPCPADLVTDGTLNLDDVGALVDAFLAGTRTADVDRSGFLNLDDVNAFLVSFLAGCP